MSPKENNHMKKLGKLKECFMADEIVWWVKILVDQVDYLSLIPIANIKVETDSVKSVVWLHHMCPHLHNSYTENNKIKN